MQWNVLFYRVSQSTTASLEQIGLKLLIPTLSARVFEPATVGLLGYLPLLGLEEQTHSHQLGQNRRLDLLNSDPGWLSDPGCPSGPAQYKYTWLIWFPPCLLNSFQRRCLNQTDSFPIIVPRAVQGSDGAFYISGGGFGSDWSDIVSGSNSIYLYSHVSNKNILLPMTPVLCVTWWWFISIMEFVLCWVMH